MGRPYGHDYSKAPGSKHGTMICAGCNEPITSGPYRAYKRSKGGDWAYVCHHRACCASDPAWVAQDAAAANSLRRQRQMLADAIAFRDLYDVSDLDDLIAELEASFTTHAGDVASVGRVA